MYQDRGIDKSTEILPKEHRKVKHKSIFTLNKPKN